MRILLLGCQGQVGWELARALAPLGEIVALNRQAADLSNPNQLADILRRFDFDVLANAAAYTAVDKAESDEDAANAINYRSVAVMAAVANEKNALLVHYSTDYVFSGGLDRPYTEDDAPNPSGAYGRSKLAGEAAVRDSGAQHLIFRTSWVHASRGSNFVRTILRLARDRDELNVVDDQFGAPTSADLIADVTAHAIADVRKSKSSHALNGLFHLTASGSTSWYDYARLVVSEALSRGVTLRLSPERIYGIPTSQYATPAKRPSNSRLDTRQLCTTYDLVMPPWEHGVHRTLAELISKEI